MVVVGRPSGKKKWRPDGVSASLLKMVSDVLFHQCQPTLTFLCKTASDLSAFSVLFSVTKTDTGCSVCGVLVGANYLQSIQYQYGILCFHSVMLAQIIK